MKSGGQQVTSMYGVGGVMTSQGPRIGWCHEHPESNDWLPHIPNTLWMHVKHWMSIAQPSTHGYDIHTGHYPPHGYDIITDHYPPQEFVQPW